MKRKSQSDLHDRKLARPGLTIVRASEGVTHRGFKQHAPPDGSVALHPAIERGMRLMRDTADAGGATVRTLFSSPGLHLSYVWFKSGFPLPLHSHDVDCYYQLIAGSMRIGMEELRKGDGVFVPAGVPYTVTPGASGAEFLEIRTSDDADTHYRAKTDAYWDRVANTRRARKDEWATEQAPYGLIPLAIDKRVGKKS
jgi:hypothetical protein